MSGFWPLWTAAVVLPERRVGWHVDGAFSTRKQKISLGDFETGLSFLSNTLPIQSPVVHTHFRFSHVFQPGYSLNAKRAFRHHNEVIAIQFSPHPFHHASTDRVGWVRKQGLMLYLLRDDNNDQFVFVEARPKPIRRLLESVWGSKFSRMRAKHTCQVAFANKTSELSATLNFTSHTVTIHFDGQHCLDFVFPETTFPEQKTSVTLMTYTYNDIPVTLEIEEVSIYREVAPVASHDQHFHHSMRKLKEHAHQHDPHYRKNASLSNTFVMSVG